MQRLTKRAARLGACAAAISALLVPEGAGAQCVLAGTPSDIIPPGWAAGFADHVGTVSVFDDGQRLAVSSANGFGIMSVQDAFLPSPLQTVDLTSAVGTCTSSNSACKTYLWRIAGARDGKNLLGADMAAPGGHALVASSTDATSFSMHGAVPSLMMSSVAIQSVDGRNIGYALPLLGGSLLAIELTGASGTPLAEVPWENSPCSAGTTMNPMADRVRVSRNWVGVQSSYSVCLLDAHAPGLAPVLGDHAASITAGMTAYEVDLGATDETLMGFDLATDPTDGSESPRLYLIASLKNETTNTVIFRLYAFDGGVVTELASVVPDAAFANAEYMITYQVGAIPVGGDITFLMWSAFSTSGTVRLYSNSLSHWSSAASYTEFNSSVFVAPLQMSLAAGTGNKVGAYIATESTAYVIPLVCNAYDRPDAGGWFPGPDASVVDPGEDASVVEPDEDASVVEPDEDASVVEPDEDASVVEPPDAAAPGADAGCVSGSDCTSADGCKAGKMVCSSTPTCSGLTAVTDGTACGTASGWTCQSGACVQCRNGDPCLSADLCSAGVLSCSGGTGTCTSLSPRADGTGCGSNRVCYQGQCASCHSGARCTPVDGCQSGKVSCTTGQPECGAPFTDLVDGTVCGGTGNCVSGVCSVCKSGAACESENGCKVGSVSCGEMATCEGYQDKTDGTACPGGACQQGACLACVAGAACESDDGCMSGSVECVSGSPKCSHLGMKPDGTTCPGGVCNGGTCRIPKDAGTEMHGDAALARADASGLPSDGGNAGLADTGSGSSSPSGCGCQSGAGASPLALLAFAALLGLRRRKRQ